MNTTKVISKNGETDSINEQKDIIIERYEKVLSLLKGVEINKNDLIHIKKPLDDLELYLKHIPNGPLFNDVFPMEIKKHILDLSSPCDTDAFIVASVCEDWKLILKNRFEDQKLIIFSEADECVNGSELLEAAAAHKLDVHLVIDKPVTEVDSKLVTNALTSVSKFTASNNLDYFYHDEILSDEQFEHLFASIEKGDKIMEEVKLVYLDLMGIDQDTLANCLVSKIKRLTIEQHHSRMLDVEIFLCKLLEDSANLKLSYLTFSNIDHVLNLNDIFCTNLVDALCKVEHVKLTGDFIFTIEMAKALMKNIIEKPIVMKTLIIDTDWVTYFKDIFSPGDLKNVFIKMTTLQLEGEFSEAQLEAVQSLSDVEVEYGNNGGEPYYVIKKGSSESF